MFNGVAEKISLVLAFLVFALALSIRLPFALYTSVLDIREAEYLDLARYFAKEGKGRSCLTRHLFGEVGSEQWSETSQPLLLPTVSGGVLSLFAHFHPEPEKMLTDMRSWLIARVTNSVVGSLAVTVWFLVSFSLIGSLVLSVLFAVLLSTNWILVQNSAANMPEQWLLLLVGLTFLILTQKRGHFSACRPFSLDTFVPNRFSLRLAVKIWFSVYRFGFRSPFATAFLVAVYHDSLAFQQQVVGFVVCDIDCS